MEEKKNDNPFGMDFSSRVCFIPTYYLENRCEECVYRGYANCIGTDIMNGIKIKKRRK